MKTTPEIKLSKSQKLMMSLINNTEAMLFVLGIQVVLTCITLVFLSY
jgi:hypothetical protein